MGLLSTPGSSRTSGEKMTKNDGLQMCNLKGLLQKYRTDYKSWWKLYTEVNILTWMEGDGI